MKNNSIRFEEARKSKTFFLFDEEKLSNENADTNFIIYYFTIGLKVLNINTQISKTQIKKIDGISNNPDNVKNVPVYLLGQLGKNDEYLNAKITKSPMEHILNIIKKAVKYVGGRVVLLECKKEKENLMRYYEKFGFVKFGNSQKDDYIEMIKILKYQGN